MSKACRRLGVAARSWDVAAGPAFDLTQRSVQRAIEHEARKGHVLASMLAPPCGSFGPAGNRRHPVRSRELPWGKDPKELSEREVARVALGNATLRAAIALIKVFHRLKIPWILEHPQASFAFQTRELQKIMSDDNVSSTVLDQCRYGTLWRKRTRLLCGNVAEQDLEKLKLMCTGSGGFCGNGRRHVILQGSAGGRDRTAAAQAYPPRLATAFAQVLTSSARAGIYNAAATEGT